MSLVDLKSFHGCQLSGNQILDRQATDKPLHEHVGIQAARRHDFDTAAESIIPGHCGRCRGKKVRSPANQLTGSRFHTGSGFRPVLKTEAAWPAASVQTGFVGPKKWRIRRSRNPGPHCCRPELTIRSQHWRFSGHMIR
jgi:hypothetical protein